MLSTQLHSIIIIVVVIVVVVVIVINSAGNSSSSNSGGGAGSSIFRSRLLEVVVFLEVVGDLMHLCVCVCVCMLYRIIRTIFPLTSILLSIQVNFCKGERRDKCLFCPGEYSGMGFGHG